MSTTSENPHSFTEAPAPWPCRGEVLWLSGYSSPASGEYPHDSAFNDLERSSSYADPNISGQFRGGLNSIMIIRYSDTPVGPYDEIIWIPGKFSSPPNNSEALRVTRIYVSSKDSVYNGRKNWNIPKELAHFTFTPSSDPNAKTIPYSKIAVAPVSDPDEPFFVADLTSTWLFSTPVIPFNTSYSPVSMLCIYPPLPQSPQWRENGQVGTDRWWSLAAQIKGKAGLFRAKGGLEGEKFGDNVGFPDVKPMSLGFWLPDAEMLFDVGEEVIEAKGNSDTKKGK
ncbi:hypothetical protein NLI96_g8694 [Meripilus lineatus]|uniref:Acetoacetate decarboxylase n=1 Tax=Meripilus lineatus TaxID=2056292 RepID=A0AAD5UWT0_9APHY|nr:hypothetical protein NLI96_g8694 [Physisporinus lineatus]